eukprot:681954-Rhodomonas_salina.1
MGLRAFYAVSGTELGCMGPGGLCEQAPGPHGDRGLAHVTLLSARPLLPSGAPAAYALLSTGVECKVLRAVRY